MKIQALAVAAATLAFAAPALPAHANDRLDRALEEAAVAHCRVLANGGTWREAIHASIRGTDYGRYWMPGAKRHSQDLYNKLLKLKVSKIDDLCPAMEARAYRQYRASKGRLPSAPTYTGWNTTISEDPFEF